MSACLDFAGPLKNQGTEGEITNYTEGKTIRVVDLPPSLCPKNSVLINDLAAACEGINALGEQGRLAEFFQPLWT